MRKFAWLLIAVVVVVAAWTVGWFWAAGEITQQVKQLAEADGETAPRFECGTLGVGGFPFRFDIDCENAVLTDRDVTVGFPGLRASVLAYNPTHTLLSAKGPFTYDDAFTGSRRRVDFDRLAGSVRVTPADLFSGLAGEGWRLARLSVESDGVSLTNTVAADILEASAGHFELHLLDIPDQFDKAAGTSALANYVAITGLNLPGLEVVSGDLTLEARITGLPADLRDFGGPDAIRKWQAAGGAVTLIKLAGAQPQPRESFEITGELQITGGGYVQGQIDYVTMGVLDRLSQFLPPVQLAVLKGAPQADGSFRNTVTIADGQVRILNLVFAQLPPLF